MRLTSDFEMPLAPPSASTTASIFRVGDTTGVGLHNHSVESLVDPPTHLEPPGEEAPLPQPRNGQSEVAHLGSEHPLAVTVAMGRSLIGEAFMELSAGEGRNISFQQVVEAPADDLRDLP